MMHGRTGLVTFPRAGAENLHICCYSDKKTGFATRVTALRASVSQGGARQFSTRPVGKTNFHKSEIAAQVS